MKDDGPPTGPQPAISFPSFAKNVMFELSPLMSRMPLPVVLITCTTLATFLPM